MSKKELRKPRSENVGAEKGFFVDHTCIGKVLNRLRRHWVTLLLESLSQLCCTTKGAAHVHVGQTTAYLRDVSIEPIADGHRR